MKVLRFLHVVMLFTESVFCVLSVNLCYFADWVWTWI